MKKKIGALLLSLGLALTSAAAVNLYVDNSRLDIDTEPMIVNSRTMVPLRAIFEALDAQVEWDNDTRTALAHKGDIALSITVDQSTAFVNGQAVTLDVPAQIVNSRTMVPARFVAEALNANVQWDQSTASVYVDTTKPGGTALAENLTISYIDVGQADSILLSCGGESMLVDAGNNADGSLVVSLIRRRAVSSLAYAVGTHPHEDHIGGLDDVINNFDVQQVWLPDVVTNTKSYADLLDAIENKGMTITVPQEGSTCSLGGATVTVLSCSPADDLNNSSIVLRVDYGENSFLFMGDAEQAAEARLLSAGANLQCDVLKVGHHGSDTSTSESFLASAAPSAAVILCGANNTYGHPEPATLEKLANIPVYRTDLNGTITIVSDGTDYTVTTEKSDTAHSVVTPPAVQPAPADEPSPAEDPSPAQGNTIYVTKSGKRYHYDSTCNGGTYYESTLADALARGLTPCNKCVK